MGDILRFDFCFVRIKFCRSFFQLLINLSRICQSIALRLEGISIEKISIAIPNRVLKFAQSKLT
ncbi:hypothetical protein C7B77_24760 [Chamaesiphon polymorphus CCALA 037]|uniref:Uncharacterized protein n=1 Tax=Chamaesiphon polymorphus CCALA 037 TaxID=2107692 RepID=A0A2T1FNG3_9CYAN|nr:hypothetical protein C7B77_24760 [Chamaesiphon polymorphus CCALA 037]